MEQEFVSYEQAVALKELGFDEKCFTKIKHKKVCEEQSKPNGCQLHNLHCGYPNCTIDRTKPSVGMPLKQQVFRWFREKHYLPSYIDTWLHDFNDYSFKWSITENRIELTSIEHYYTYEEAENACIDKLIELSKQLNNK